MMTIKSEEMFLPIDLESTLGRIDESQEGQASSDASVMMECEPVTRTCEQSPFREDMKQDYQQFIPYPIVETADEVKERPRFGASVGKFLAQSPTLTSCETIQVDWVPEDLAPIDDPVGDDFSVSTSADDSIEVDDNPDFEDIEDRVSFWDEANADESGQPRLAPSVSFSSHADISML
jgi:hypothetical protein